MVAFEVFSFFLNTFHARIKNFFQGPGGGGLRKLIKFAGDRGPGGGGSRHILNNFTMWI